MYETATQHQRARATFLVFALVGIGVTIVVGILTENLVLGALYGLLPGGLLGGLAWFRISRGGLLKRVSSKDRPGPF